MAVMTPEQYIQKIRPLRSPEAIQAVCEELISKLFNPTDKPKTRINKLTPYNKVINSIPPDELVVGENAYEQTRKSGQIWIRHLHYRYTGIEETNFNQEGGINRSTSKIQRLKTQKRIDVTSYLNITLKLLESDNVHELAVGLIAASGRRSVEVLARGKFSQVKKLPEGFNPDYSVTFRGQAKKRDYGMEEEERTEYPIGVLVPAKMFLEAFNRYSQKPEAEKLKDFIAKNRNVDAEAVNKKIEDNRGNSLRRVCQQYFGSLPLRENETNPSPKVLRAIYSVLITERDCPEHYNKLFWASQQLGHFIDKEEVDDADLQSLVTTVGYMDYYIEEPVPFVGQEVQAIQETSQEPETVQPEEVQPVKSKETEPVKAEKAKPEPLGSIKLAKSCVERLNDIKKANSFTNQTQSVLYLVEKAEKATALEEENNQLKAKIKELESQNKKLAAEAQSLDIDKLVERKIQQQLQKLLPQLQSGNIPVISEGTETKPVTTSRSQPRKEKTDIDYEDLSREKLLEIKSPGAAREKIRRSFLAICAHNDAQPSNETRWAINNQALRQLSRTNGLMVGDWMKEHQTAIDDHNQKYGLGLYHNKGKGDISEIIKWE